MVHTLFRYHITHLLTFRRALHIPATLFQVKTLSIGFTETPSGGWLISVRISADISAETVATTDPFAAVNFAGSGAEFCSGALAIVGLKLRLVLQPV